jgi:uncharacterized protein
MMLHRALVLVPFLALAACGPAPGRVTVPEAPTEARVSIAYGSVEVRTVSLPTYAQAEEIFVIGDDGALSRIKGVLWADEPARAMTLDLSRALATITRARVAAEPWPFDATPDARVDVRVSAMLAAPGRDFRLSGQYFVAAFDGSDRGAARSFDIAVPLAAGADAAVISQARAAATVQLAEGIARDGLR